MYVGERSRTEGYDWMFFKVTLQGNDDLMLIVNFLIVNLISPRVTPKPIYLHFLIRGRGKMSLAFIFLQPAQ
jgi:hypothetical protein